MYTIQTDLTVSDESAVLLRRFAAVCVYILESDDDKNGRGVKKRYVFRPKKNKSEDDRMTAGSADTSGLKTWQRVIGYLINPGIAASIITRCSEIQTFESNVSTGKSPKSEFGTHYPQLAVQRWPPPL